MIQEESLGLGIIDRSVPIQVISTNEYPLAATRPWYSALDCSTTAEALGIRPTDLACESSQNAGPVRKAERDREHVSTP